MFFKNTSQKYGRFWRKKVSAMSLHKNIFHMTVAAGGIVVVVGCYVGVCVEVDAVLGVGIS